MKANKNEGISQHTHTHRVTVEQLKSHSRLWMCTSTLSCFSLFLYRLLMQEGFRYHSALPDYCSFHSLYSGLNNCFKGRHPKETEFSEKETKLTFIPLQKAFPGAPARGTSRDVHCQENHPNVKTSLHRVLSNLSNKLQFLAHETGGMDG